MISRSALEGIRDRLEHFDCVGILGPRQVGKTTLARDVADSWSGPALYLDLQQPEDVATIGNIENGEAGRFLEGLSDHLVVLDEIHKTPEIFAVLRGQIDDRRRQGIVDGKFLVLGSASVTLLRQSSESLTGRIAPVELNPLTLQDILRDRERAMSPTLQADAPMDAVVERQSTTDPIELADQHWLRGGYPDSFTRTDDRVSLQWRLDYIRSYLERDIPEFGIEVASDDLKRFWDYLVVMQGDLFISQNVARTLRLSTATVDRYARLLSDLYLVRRLAPWSTNLGKRLVDAPKYYVRDSGIYHALAGIGSLPNLNSHELKGKSWEGYVIESLISAAGEYTRPYFYRTRDNAEVDLVLEFVRGSLWTVEVKSTTNVPQITPGFHSASNDLGAERRIVVYRGEARQELRSGVELMPLIPALSEVRMAAGEIGQ